MSEQNWREVGRVIGLQIQLDQIKVGTSPRLYQPQVIRAVPTFTVTKDGVIAEIDGQAAIDVHHKDHPRTRNKQVNGVSFGLTSYYERMQERFGPQLSVGIAGENILVETDELLTEDDLANGVAFRSPDGTLTTIDNVYAMAPCEPFTTFCLGGVVEAPEQMREGLLFLSNGMRGFTGEILDTDTHVLQVGDTLLVKV